MARTLLTSTLIAIVASLAWLSRTVYYEHLRSPFLHRLFGTDASLNTAPLASALTHPCPSKLEVIYVRGILEPPPLGFNLGGLFKRQLASRAAELGLGTAGDEPDVLFVGLDHLANTSPDDMAAGVDLLISRVARRSAQCPGASFALVGYSQGADIIRYALRDGMAAHADRISSIVTFGDPLVGLGYPPYYTGRTLGVCNAGDRGCGGEGVMGHFKNYGMKDEGFERLRGAAVDFVLDRGTKEVRKGEGEKEVKALPGYGDGGAFLVWWQDWPKTDFMEKYGGGVVPPVLGLRGVGSVEDIWSGYERPDTIVAS